MTIKEHDRLTDFLNMIDPATLTVSKGAGWFVGGDPPVEGDNGEGGDGDDSGDDPNGDGGDGGTDGDTDGGAGGDDTNDEPPPPPPADPPPAVLPPITLEALAAENAALKQRLDKFETALPPVAPKPSTAPATPPTTKAATYRSQRVEFDDKTHPMHGKTFGQIYDMDPDLAYSISPSKAQELQFDAYRQESSAKERQSAVEVQINNERQELATTLLADFGPTPTAEQRSSVNNTISKVEEWMVANNKVGITISDAYILMEHRNLISKAASSTAKKIVDAAQRGGVRTVSSKKDGNGSNAAGADMAKWSESQMMDYLDGLTLTDRAKFYTTASKAVRSKFSSLPWPE